ncbi:hypothetical protein C8R46DRAFT_1184289 [Mycena filopes]|nr:hypothetical protein C8R46DRAFT_1184289 [Mycena filopes]
MRHSKFTRPFVSLAHSTLSQRKPGVSPVTPDAVLPIEIWDYIFRYCFGNPTSDSDSPEDDDRLLSLAATCSAFNDLCVPLYLLRHGVSSASLTSGTLAVQGPLTLKALRLGFFLPPITSLSWRATTSRAKVPLLFLRDLTHRAKSLQRLEVAFEEDLFYYRDGSSKSLGTGKNLLADVTTPFRDILHSMAARFDGPVVVVTPLNVFTTRASDIRHWSLHQYHFGFGLSGLGSYFRKPTTGAPTVNAGVRLHDGTSAKIPPITSLTSVLIHAIPAIAGTGSSTLIVLNHREMMNLVLGCFGRSDDRGFSMPGRDLSAVLPHLTLPALSMLSLTADDIDPGVLARFLARHQHSLSILHYNPPPPPPPSQTERGPLVTHAVALPHLRILRSKDPANMLRLLAALEVPATRKFPVLNFHFNRTTPADIAKLAALLRRLASVAGASMHLDLVLVVGAARERPLSDEEVRVAASLAGVRSVRLTLPHGVTESKELLQWLGLLPQLQSLTYGGFE